MPRARYGASQTRILPTDNASLPRDIAPHPESSFHVHWVAVTEFIELDAFPTVQRTTHFSGDHTSKHVSTHIMAECNRKEPRTSCQVGI